MQLKVVGLATDINDNAKNWIKGVKTAGLRYKLLGVGHTFTGWKMRSKLYVDELEKDPDIDIVIFSDVYDVLVNKTKVEDISEIARSVKHSPESANPVEKYIIDTFLSFSKPIVIGAELGCWPKNCYYFNLMSLFNTFGNNYIFPNGGLVIGYREPLIQLYKHLQNHPDDQYEIGKLTQTFPTYFGLDYSSKLFYNNHARQDRNRLEGALFIHFPGMDFSLFSRSGYNRMSEEQGYTSVIYTKRKCIEVAITVVIGTFIGLLFLFWVYYGNPRTIKNVNYIW